MLEKMARQRLKLKTLNEVLGVVKALAGANTVGFTELPENVKLPMTTMEELDSVEASLND